MTVCCGGADVSTGAATLTRGREGPRGGLLLQPRGVPVSTCRLRARVHATRPPCTWLPGTPAGRRWPEVQGQGLSVGRPPHRGPRAPHPSPPPPRLTPLRIYSLTSHKKSKLKAQKAKFKAHVLRDTHSAGVGFASARGAGAAPAHVTADHLCWALNRPRSL